MSGYTKLFGSILDSTVWATPATVRVVWITMLAMADQDGVVEAAVPGLAKRAGVTREDCESALALFLAPDPDSRSKEHGGRRIEEWDGGWRLVNYEKYRDRATKAESAAKSAARQRRYRARQAANATVTPRNAALAKMTQVTHSEAEAEAEAEADKPPFPLSPATPLDSSDVARIWSEIRRAHRQGSYRIQHTEQEITGLAIEWAIADHPSDPLAALRRSLEHFAAYSLPEGAFRAWEYRLWASDPGRWHATSHTNVASSHAEHEAEAAQDEDPFAGAARGSA